MSLNKKEAVGGMPARSDAGEKGDPGRVWVSKERERRVI